jgi:tetratricopeptide (TPR) repeat protein
MKFWNLGPKFGLVIVAVMMTAPLTAQTIDYTREQYDAYQKCSVIADASVKQACMLAFIEANPKLSLVQYAIGEYGKALQEQIKNGEHAKVLEAGITLLELRPNDANTNLITQLCYSAYSAGKYGLAAPYCEKTYATNPAPGLTLILANSYQKLGENSKYRDWGAKAIDTLEPAQALQYVIDFRSQAARAEQWRQAANYSRKTLSTLSAMSRSENVSAADWGKFVSRERSISYLLLGRNDYESQNWARSTVNYQRVLDNTRDRNMSGEAYYYIGMCNWKENRLTPAMEAFARGANLKGSPHAATSSGYLVRLYKSTHNDSDAGIGEFRDRANAR